MPIPRPLQSIISPAVAFALAGVVVWAWPIGPFGRGLDSALLSLGLDDQRSGIVVELAGAVAAAAVAAVITNRFVFPWIISCFWYGSLVVSALAIRQGPVTLPGETVAPLLYAMSLVALASCGAAAAGVGAAIGYGVRRWLIAAGELRRSRSPSKVGAGVAGLLLLGASLYGLVRLPGILLYGPWSGVVVAARPTAQGEQLTFDYWSTAFAAYRSAVVYLPPQYAASPSLAFPVLYLLHGSPGSDLDWSRMGAAGIAGEAEAAGRLPAAVIVYPNGVGPHGGAEDHWADDYVPGDRMESDLIGSLIPAIDSQFRVVPDAAHRAIGGLSAGGYGAANLALRHPGTFGLALVFGGDLAPEVTAFGADQRAIVANDPLRLALAPKPANAAAFFVGWGASDPVGSENKLFAQRLRTAGYTVTTAVVPGAHTWDVWRRLLLSGLDATGRALAGPEAEP